METRPGLEEFAPAFEAGRLPLAATLFRRLIEQDGLEDFLTLVAYDHI